MLGLAELLSALDLPGQAAIWLATLQACGQQLASLIDRSLTPGVNSSGSARCMESNIDGRNLLEQLICSHWPAAQAGDVQLHLIFQPAAQAYWQLDPVALRQVLDNLLANAIRFSRSGHVVLEASVLPSAMSGLDMLQLSVENCSLNSTDKGKLETHSGLQIADHQLPGCFDYADRSYRMFSRGQGLPLVQQLSHRMNGRLQEQVTALGGVRYVLQLPAVVPAAPTQIKPFNPKLLKMLHCQLSLEQPMERVVVAILESLELSFECTEALGEAAIRAMPVSQILICHPSRLPLLVAASGISGRSICILVNLASAGASELYIQPLPEPLLLSELQTALLRCLVLSSMAVCRAQEAVE